MSGAKESPETAQKEAGSVGISLIEEFLSKGQGLRTSKEEKERQNEELVNEMSTDGYEDFSVDVTPKRSSGTACFIDASSLYDETEFSSMTSAESGSRDSRQELEKRQGYFIFKNSIHQYSGHPIAPSSSGSKDEEEGFEIIDYPDPNQTPQNSLAYVPDDEGRVEEPAPIFNLPKKRNPELAPIVSGGVPPTPQDLRKIDSPSLRRRTEMCPILSGGSVDVEEPQRPKKRSSSVSSASWIVDFSDCKREPKPSLNYFGGPEDERRHLEGESENPKSLQLTRSTGFFIDLSDASGSVPHPKKTQESAPVPEKDRGEDKKNIFSMFIDFDDKAGKKPRQAPRLSSSFRVETPPQVEKKVETKTVEEEELKTPSSTSSGATSGDRAGERRRRTDAKINETFDKSSVCSLTDGILSKDLSPVSTTDEATYQRDSDGSMIPLRVDDTATASEMQSAMESITAAAEMQKQLLDTPTEQKKALIASEFVRLSDLDKPSRKGFREFDRKMSSSADTSSRMRPWGDSQLYKDDSAETSMVNLLASSVENSKSLSRLFPHLNDVYSKSLPNDVELNNFRNSSYMSEIMQSDISNTTTTSSVTSGLDSPDESSISCRQPRRLGEDLLKMFLQEIATDIVVEVGNRKMRAHKCILRSRCQYFAAILAGNWVQNAGNAISLSGYSYAAVHFALCHIYSGASYPPQGISLMELASLSDLLGLEGLKEVTTYALKINYCHNFHKPCSGCIEGVMQVFPVTLNHGLDDLYRKCLKWSCKYYTKVWPTRSFALLPTDLIYRCRQQILAHMNSESVLNTIIDCEQMVSVLELSRWAIVVENIVREILDSACMYVADHFANLLASDSFLSLGHGKSWAIQHLEDLLLRTASTLTPDQACKSYPRAVRLNTLLTVPNSLSFDSGDPKMMENDNESLNWSEEFVKLISAILSATEQCLIRQCSRAMKCSSWQRMDPNLRSKVQKLSCITDVIEEKKISHMRKAAPNFQMLNHHSRDSGLNQIRLAIQAAHNNRRAAPLQPSASASSVPKPLPAPKMGTGKVPVRVESAPIQKTASHAAVDRVRYQNGTSNSTSASTSRKGSGSNEKRSSSTTLSQSSSSLHKSRLAEVKPRYLEPRKVIQVPEGKGSNASSRTSSPSMARKKIQGVNKASKESTNISLDSLSTTPNVRSSRNTSKESLAAQKTRPQLTNGHTRKGGSGNSSHSSSIATNSRLSAVRNSSYKAKSTDSSPNAPPKSFFTARSRNILLLRASKQEESKREAEISQIPSARERNKMRAQLGIKPTALKTPTAVKKYEITTTKEKNLKNLVKKKEMAAKEVPKEEPMTYSRLERSSTFCKETSDNPDLVQID